MSPDLMSPDFGERAGAGVVTGSGAGEDFDGLAADFAGALDMPPM
jgi:hypothetical protein